MNSPLGAQFMFKYLQAAVSRDSLVLLQYAALVVYNASNWPLHTFMGWRISVGCEL